MNCYIGIDIGTSTIKCLLISEEGDILACSKQRNDYYLDSSGMVEFNAEERYNSICSLIKRMLQYLPSTAQVLSLAIVMHCYSMSIGSHWGMQLAGKICEPSQFALHLCSRLPESIYMQFVDGE